MRIRILILMAVALGCVVVSAKRAYAVYTEIPFVYNANLDIPFGGVTHWEFDEMPKGSVILGGIPFKIPETGLNYWSSHDFHLTTQNPRSLEILVNDYGVGNIYTLINTFGGWAGGPYVALEFIGDKGAYYRKDLYGDIDIRDWNYSQFTNSINGTSTINVWRTGPAEFDRETRLDMQNIVLPSEFLNQTLTVMRLVDNGWTTSGQRAFLAGVTVDSSPVPIPATVWLLGSGIGLVGLISRKKRLPK